MHNPGTMWYNICNIIQQILCNIRELYIMALSSATSISMTFYLPNIRPFLSSILEPTRTHSTHDNLHCCYFMKYNISLIPDKTCRKHGESLKKVGILWNSTLVLKEDKLSTTTVVFIRSEGKLKTKCLYWIWKPKKS